MPASEKLDLKSEFSAVIFQLPQSFPNADGPELSHL